MSSINAVSFSSARATKRLSRRDLRQQSWHSARILHKEIATFGGRITEHMP